jgi:hypothetical protein
VPPARASAGMTSANTKKVLIVRIREFISVTSGKD